MLHLTADLHHDSAANPGVAHQNHASHAGARVYCDIAEKHGLKVTLFVTGKLAAEHPICITELSERQNVYVAPHTYSMLRKNSRERTAARAFRSKYGSPAYQWADITRSTRIFEGLTGRSQTIWRTHSYASNWVTRMALRSKGYRAICDVREDSDGAPRNVGGKLESVPINVMPDHEHLIYGNRTREHVAHLSWKGDPWGTESYESDAWLKMVCGQIEAQQSRGNFSNLLVHSQTMDALDGFETFERLCAFIGKYDNQFISELVNR